MIRPSAVDESPVASVATWPGEGAAAMAPPTTRPAAFRPVRPSRPPEAESQTARPSAAGLSQSAPEEINDEVPARSRIISPSLLLPAEVVLFELKPSLWYVVFVSLPIAAAGLAVIILSLSIQVLPTPYRHLGIVLGMWVVGLRVAVALLQWLGRTYVLTDRRILVQTGVFDARVEALALERVESSFVAQAVVQRLLGIGTIFFRTMPGSGGGSLSWEHVRRPRELHGHVVAQIDRWKHTLEHTAQQQG